MRTKVIFAILCLLICVGVLARAQTPVTNLGGLSWLAGNWTGTQGAVEMEEYWQEPKGNTMLGIHRDVSAGRTVSFEFLRIEANAEGVTYWASPHGKPATPFRLIEQTGKRAVFENAKHDFHQSVIYWVGDDGALHAKIEGNMNGKHAAEAGTWRKVTGK